MYLYKYDSRRGIYRYAAGTGKPATENGPLDNDTLAFPWDAAGRRTATQLDGSLIASYTYDALGRLTSVVNQGGAGIPARVLSSFVSVPPEVG
jgi:YD repeat-containing protein